MAETGSHRTAHSATQSGLAQLRCERQLGYFTLRYRRDAIARPRGRVSTRYSAFQALSRFAMFIGGVQEPINQAGAALCTTLMVPCCSRLRYNAVCRST